MQTKSSVYKEIFSFYKVHFTSRQDKQSAYKYIRDNLKRQFPSYDWSDTGNWYKLSIVDRNQFKLVTVRDHFTERSELGKKEINKKIATETKDNYIDARIKIKEQNEFAYNMHRKLYDKNASEEENRASYIEFCSLLPKCTFTTQTPSYEEFMKGPETLYNYYMSDMAETLNHYPEDDDPVPVTNADVDHIALQSIIKFLEEKHAIKVDFDGIRDCLSTSFAYTADAVEPVEENEETLRFFAAQKRLDDLDFVIKI